MSYRAINPAIKANVREAVEQAMAGGSPFSPTKVAKQFADSGIHYATLLRWIDKYETEFAISVAKSSRDIAEVRRQQPIAYEALLSDGIQDNLAAIASGKREDGSIKNPRLVMEGRDRIRQHIQTAAQVQETLTSKQMIEFLRAVGDVIRQEPPDVRDRIVGKMRAMNISMGLL